MVLSFNPVNANHWIKKHFIDSKLATVCHSTYKDNKFLSKEDIEALEMFKDIDPYYYTVYCLGQWGVLGKTYFNAEKISKRLAEIVKPIKKGYFVYEYDGDKPKGIKFREDPDGFVEIYELPKKDVPYVLAGDTAGDGSDYFTAHVIDNITSKQVAKVKKQFDADEYTRQIYCLARYYNNALVGLETNFDTFPIKELLRFGYDKQYVREREDTYTNNIVKSFGFQTNKKTRPLILSILQQIINENIEWISDKDTLEEMLTFVRNEKGRPEAQEGAHDDLIMALAIVYYIRDQQKNTIERKQIKKEFYNFDFERPDGADSDLYSEEVII